MKTRLTPPEKQKRFTAQLPLSTVGLIKRYHECVTEKLGPGIKRDDLVDDMLNQFMAKDSEFQAWMKEQDRHSKPNANAEDDDNDSATSSDSNRAHDSSAPNGARPSA